MVTLLTYSTVNDLEYGRGYGRNIKQVQNAAARDVVQALRQEFFGQGLVQSLCRSLFRS